MGPEAFAEEKGRNRLFAASAAGRRILCNGGGYRERLIREISVRQGFRKRVIVLAAGAFNNFVLGFRMIAILDFLYA